MSLLRLSQKKFKLFELISKAAFSNPFSSERYQHDKKILERFAQSSFGNQDPEEKIQLCLEYELNELKGNESNWRLYKQPDADYLRVSFIFYLYYKFRYAFDQFLNDSKEGNPLRPNNVWPEVKKVFLNIGFDMNESGHYFALLYQLRRAYFYIQKILIGESESIKRLRQDLWFQIFTADSSRYGFHLWDKMRDFSILIQGETGTGKGACARVIGLSGYIPFNPENGLFEYDIAEGYLETNLESFSKNLIESELFGHKRGSFTGAFSDREGLLERCKPFGSVFLDEIGDLDHSIQLKLLQVLQERFFYAVGSNERKSFLGRVIAATNLDLNHLRETKTFRDDFYYRLCSSQITIPNLSRRIVENKEELQLLVKHILSKLLGSFDDDLYEQVLSKLKKSVPRNYCWPGNVRELEQAVRRVLVQGSYLGDPKVDKSQHTISEEKLYFGQNPNYSSQELLSHYVRFLYVKNKNLVEVAKITNLDRRTVKKYLGL